MLSSSLVLGKWNAIKKSIKKPRAVLYVLKIKPLCMISMTQTWSECFVWWYYLYVGRLIMRLQLSLKLSLSSFVLEGFYRFHFSANRKKNNIQTYRNIPKGLKKIITSYPQNQSKRIFQSFRNPCELQRLSYLFFRLKGEKQTRKTWKGEITWLHEHEQPLAIFYFSIQSSTVGIYLQPTDLMVTFAHCILQMSW